MKNKYFICCVFIAFILIISSSNKSIHAGMEFPSWGKAEIDVDSALLRQKISLTELATRVKSSKPKNAQEAMFKLNVLMRSGINKEAIETLKELKELYPKLGSHKIEIFNYREFGHVEGIYQIESIYYSACDKSAWDLARELIEIFADVVYFDIDSRLITHLINSGWSVGKVDKWLESMPVNINKSWIAQRLRFNVKHGRGETMVMELSDDVRKNPRDISNALFFLKSLYTAQYTTKEKWDLSWMAETIKPELASEANDIAWYLKELSNCTTAVVFYRRAVEIPLTREDLGRMEPLQKVLSLEDIQKNFSIRVREEMVECLHKNHNDIEALKWKIEATAMLMTRIIDRKTPSTGQVQSLSEEESIKKKLKENNNDTQYWMKLIAYYHLIRDSNKTEEAMKKALELTSPQPERFLGKGDEDLRSNLLTGYAYFLMNAKREEEAVALLRNEIEKSPANSMSVIMAVRILESYLEGYIRVDDELLWNWISSRKKWDYEEERLLKRMLEKTNQDNIDKYLTRAEELTKENHPSRAYVLGWIIYTMKFPARSIPLLEYASGITNDTELKERSTFTLFQSYLDIGDWKIAENIFMNATKRLTSSEVPYWHSRMAVVAAKSGAKEDAIRLWKDTMNFSPYYTNGLDDLVNMGLKDQLVELYQNMQNEMPDSEIPGKALKILEEK